MLIYMLLIASAGKGHVTIVPTRPPGPSWRPRRGEGPSQKPVDSIPNVVLCLYMTKEIDKIFPVQ